MNPTATPFTASGTGTPLKRLERKALRCLLIALVLFLSTPPLLSQQKPRLLLYLHTSMRARALEAALEARMTQVDVVVCSRYRDFALELTQNPDAALAVQPVLQASGLIVHLQGIRADSDAEPYVLLAIGRTIQRAEFASISVGSVDLMGREKTKRFVAQVMGLETAPDVRYVVKPEDLLPLLQFGGATAILLSAQEAARIRSESQLDLRTTPLPTRVGLPAASFRTEVGRTTVRASLDRLDLENRNRLGVESWR